MTALTRTTLLMLLTAAPAFAQVPKKPAQDLSVHTTKVPGLEVRFVDYHWQPDLIAAMEKGSRDVPAAQRDWVLARVMVEPRPLKFEGVTLPLASYALSLFPNQDGKGLVLELRSVDMHAAILNMNAVGPAPKGETMWRGPAKFEIVSAVVPRLDIKATEVAGAPVVTVLYGDRRLSLKFAR